MRKNALFGGCVALIVFVACGEGPPVDSEGAYEAAVSVGSTYTITGVDSGKCVEIAGGSTADGAAAQIATCSGSTRQQFRFEDMSGGYFRIRNVNSNRCLDVEGASTATGARVLQWTCGTGNNQQFLVNEGGGVARFLARHSGQAIDVNGRGKADGTPLIQWTFGDSANQQFRLAIVGGGGGSGGSGGSAGTGGSGGSAGAAGAAGSAGTAGTAGSGSGGGTPRGTGSANGRRQVENLSRGLVAAKVSNGVFLSWRLLGYEPQNLGFNVYRGGTKLNGSVLTGGTNYLDSAGTTGASYTVRAVLNGVEQAASPAAVAWAQNFLDVPIQPPAGGTTPDGVAYTYTASDTSAADLDGDGELELVLKWEPTNAKDNSQAGYTGNVFLDGYELNGTRLWRIDLGRNIRAGAHYTQFMVYDFEGDGKAEVACKTADGTRDSAGTVIGSSSADHRNSSGYVLAGPEFLTVFDGQNGRIRSTTDYVPARGTVSSWGDNYGNRVDRFLAGVAYLDGARPSLIMARGYYTRTVIVAWDFRSGQLTRRWTFDSSAGSSSYAGQGNHQLSIADVDGDGRDEVVYGAMVVDDNGAGLYTTGLGHGDALHVGDLVPSRPGLEVFDIQERVDTSGAHLRDARTGANLFRKATAAGSGEGPGRGVGADIYAGNPGAEFWVAGGGISGLFNASGGNVGRQPSSANFLIWWDADPVRELLDRTRIDKYGTGGDTRLLTGSGVVENNGTKATPALSGDLFGDWREEVIWRTTDNRALRIYTTTIASDRRLFTLLHDTQYRVAIAWQNVAYNQPPHPSFFLGDGMATPAQPDIHVR